LGRRLGEESQSCERDAELGDLELYSTRGGYKHQPIALRVSANHLEHIE
jgi:hypothetical protein